MQKWRGVIFSDARQQPEAHGRRPSRLQSVNTPLDLGKSLSDHPQIRSQLPAALVASAPRHSPSPSPPPAPRRARLHRPTSGTRLTPSRPLGSSLLDAIFRPFSCGSISGFHPDRLPTHSLPMHPARAAYFLFCPCPHGCLWLPNRYVMNLPTPQVSQITGH